MEKFAAIVRIGDPIAKWDPQDVAGILRVHIDERCWTSGQRHEFRPGTPIVASHTGGGRGQFLVGVATGETLDELPWTPAPEHAQHLGYRVHWMDAIFRGDADAVHGASGRHMEWLTLEEFRGVLAQLEADAGPPAS